MTFPFRPPMRSAVSRRALGLVVLPAMLWLAQGALAAEDAGTPPGEPPGPRAETELQVQPAAGPVEFVPIDIDRYVATARPAKAGTRAIIRPSPVRFEGRLKQGPRPQKTDYLYTALGFFPLDPKPQVSQGMFVETPGGHVLPVYVDDTLLEPLKKHLAEGQAASFRGWHVYTYSKGPAILVVGFEPAPVAAGAGAPVAAVAGPAAAATGVPTGK